MQTIHQKLEDLLIENFNSLWEKEEKNITRLWNSFTEFSKSDNQNKMFRYKNPAYRNWTEADWSVTDYIMYVFAEGKPYEVYDQKPYWIKEAKRLRAKLATIKFNGLDKYLAKEKIAWFEMMKAKLSTYSKKMLFPNDVYKIGVIKTSPKGFIVAINFTRDGISCQFNTTCFPAGGTNIQCFHFRYKGNVSISE